ncbi:MAG: DUF2779 domain-containing protein [Chitinophagales bacterium]|nr:DUF2779 domain-containing protein [Chitinophagales bacterium]
MTRHILSKSTFLKGCQCHKYLWLYKHKYEARDEESEGLSSTFSQGISVGELARNLFPGGVDASPIDHFNFQQSVLDTAKYIEQGQKVIYEAAFQYDGVLIAIDILVNEGGKWYAYEVKASTKVKDIFIQDVALQYHVITNCGIDLADISVIHLNNKYVRFGDLDIKQLFTIESVLNNVLSMQDAIAGQIEVLKGVVASNEEPEIEMGNHCNNPYDCDFIGYCKDLDPFSECFPIDQVVNINVSGINEFLSELVYPLQYMDFETYMVAVPEHDGHWPYRQVPFQFSLHIESKGQKTLKHHQFIGKPGASPTREFIETLLNAVSGHGSIVVYNKAFENTRLNELKLEFPEFEEQITGIQDRFVDLMVPFRKKYYENSALNGKYSIKRVLPVIFPELSYEDLNITNGSDASTIYYNLRNETDEILIEKTTKDLFEYCKLDTLAMVQILNELKKLTNDF